MHRVALATFVLGAFAALSFAGSGQLTGGGGLASVTHTARMTGSGTTTAPLDLASSGVSAGSYTNTSVTFDAFGRATAASSGTADVPTSRALTAGTGLTGGGDLSADRSFAIANTGVSANTYTLPTLTINAQGQATSASDTSLSGDVTNSGAAVTIATNVVSNAKLAQMATNTIKGNSTGSTANAADLTASQVAAIVAPALSWAAGWFGDGSLGAAVFDGAGAVTGTTRSGSTYSATQDLFFTTCTFSSGVTLNLANGTTGFALYCNASLTGPGSGSATIKADGNAASGASGGAALGNGSPIFTTSAAGTSGIQNAGQAGQNAGAWGTSFRPGVGGNGGASATNAGASGGGAGSLLTDAAASFGDMLNAWNARSMQNTIITGGAGGASGGGTTGVASGGGGGGGAGFCRVAARTIVNPSTLVLTANGGAGANGTGGNAGGGGGGGGGYALLRFGGAVDPRTLGLTITAAGGAGGSPAGTGNAGTSGGSGQVRVYLLGVSN